MSPDPPSSSDVQQPARKPPNDAARLRLFLSLVAEYRELAANLPAEKSLVIGAAEPRNPSDHWHRLLRIFALRKFVNYSDEVDLRKVAESLDAMMPTSNPDLVAQVNDLVEQARQGLAVYGTTEKSLEHANSIVEDVLYGIYLHGDYDRWQRHEQRPRYFVESAVWEWVQRIEALIYAFERTIRNELEDGSLDVAENDSTDT